MATRASRGRRAPIQRVRLMTALALVGGAVSGIAFSRLGGASERVALTEVRSSLVTVPVARRPVSAGTLARGMELSEITIPRDLLPPGAVQSVVELDGKIATEPIAAGAPLLRNSFGIDPASVANPVAGQIPSGMRAMTVQVDATAAVEGWAWTGSLVDVLLSESGRTTVVAEKVRILSAERSVEPKALEETQAVPRTVTLLVSQEQCLAINTAIPLGKISFALRSPDDGTGWNTTTYTADKFQRGRSAKEERVTGYVSVQGTDGADAFALTNGRWVRTRMVPDGVLVNRTDDEARARSIDGNSQDGQDADER